MAAPHWLSRAASALSLSPPGPSNAVPGPTEASASLPPVQGKTLELFTLSLDDGKTIYLPGQRVEGTLSLSFSTPTPVKLLRVRITGLIGTQMTKNDVSLSNHLSSLILFKDLANLGGTGTPEAPLVDFPAGESVHPFSFRLPASALPASFEGAYGKVRYEVIAILMAPGMTKKTVSIPLTVPSTVSDQTHPDVLREPIGQSLSLDTFSPWGWRTGHVDIQARLPKTGFNSGNFTNLCRLEMPNSHLSVIEEIAPLTLDLTNHSQHAVKITEICIKQKVTYKMLHEYALRFGYY